MNDLTLKQIGYMIACVKATVKHVADEAGVSVGTVSRYLNNVPTVSKDKGDLVAAAIRKLNYVPQRKQSRRNCEMPLHDMNIALVMLGMDRSLVSLPVVAEAIHGAETADAKAGGHVYLANAPHLDHLPPVLLRSRLDGIILKGALQGDAICRSLAPLTDRLRRIPSVWLLGRPEGCVGDMVGANDLRVGQLAADFLLDKGHDRLAFINPKRDHVTFNRRYIGFRARAVERGATVHEFLGENPGEWVLPLHSAHDVGVVQRLIDQMLALEPKCTAVFAPADSITALLYRELTSRGLQVGRDISVISSNNEQTIISGLHPSVTTVDTHAAMIGSFAVEQLIWRINHPGELSVEILLEPELIVRESVAEQDLHRSRRLR